MERKDFVKDTLELLGKSEMVFLTGDLARKLIMFSYIPEYTLENCDVIECYYKKDLDINSVVNWFETNGFKAESGIDIVNAVLIKDNFTVRIKVFKEHFNVGYCKCEDSWNFIEYASPCYLIAELLRSIYIGGNVSSLMDLTELIRGIDNNSGIYIQSNKETIETYLELLKVDIAKLHIRCEKLGSRVSNCPISKNYREVADLLTRIR